MESFKEKYGPWALVVGSSEGLGECFANECASRGLNVVLCARTISRADLEKVEKNIRETYGVDVRIVEADISEEESGDIIVKGIDDLEVGFVIFNAAIEPGGSFIRIKPEDHQKAIIGNCVTPTKVVWYLARKMAKRKRGGIYLISSIAAEGGIANWVSYGASKSYEMILGEGLWYEMKAYGVDAGTYVVGSTETPNFKKGQEKHGTGLTGDSKPEGIDTDSLQTGVVPRTPTFVASYLFDQIGKGPRLYSHPDDLDSMTKMRMISREDYVNAISQTTTKYHIGGMNELLEDV
ncbi:MAG: SDR family NAD(P)-dependent oxidoreductase [Firmicutes bacterium]|nr:SDR family NAD(P)-dependent oxidoreductase [Bacillota bacterium]